MIEKQKFESKKIFNTNVCYFRHLAFISSSISVYSIKWSDLLSFKICKLNSHEVPIVNKNSSIKKYVKSALIISPFNYKLLIYNVLCRFGDWIL